MGLNRSGPQDLDRGSFQGDGVSVGCTVTSCTAMFWSLKGGLVSRMALLAAGRVDVRIS
jgi:hypothetical protein